MANSLLLTQKQESFCLEYVKSTNATQAYIYAYGSGKMAAATLNRNAHRLMENPKVIKRIESLRKPAVEKAQLTVESHLDMLKDLREEARLSDNHSAAIKAEELRGKVAGFYVLKTEDVTDPIKKAMSNMKPADAEAMLNALDHINSLKNKAKSAA